MINSELVYIGKAPTHATKGGSKQGRAFFRCFCGKEFISSIQRVRKGNTRSCGCIRTKQLVGRNTKHGLSGHAIYRAWKNMICRCYNPKHQKYKHYSKHGITVCDRWLNSFDDFYNDVSPTHKNGLTLDRFPDQNGNYEPDNFRWATCKEQALNKRNNNIVEYNGGKAPLKEMCHIFNLNVSSVIYKTKRGISFQDAANSLIERKRKKS